MKRVILGTFSAALVLAGAPIATAANLVHNGSFESFGNDAPTVATNWNYGGAAGSAARDTSIARSGVTPASLNLNTLSGGGARGDCITTGIAPMTTYYFSYWYTTFDVTVDNVRGEVRWFSGNTCAAPVGAPLTANEHTPTMNAVGGPPTWHQVNAAGAAPQRPVRLRSC